VEGSRASNFDESHWRGPDAHSGSWEVTPPASPRREVRGMEEDSSWPALAAQVNEWCGTWGPFPADTLEVDQMVEVEEKSSVGESTGECSACRLTMT
jgi:hypothetical protein